MTSFLDFGLQSCINRLGFESDGWTSKGALAQGQFEILNYVGSDGTARLVRVPSGMTRGMSGKSVKDGSLEAKDGIKWQDRRVPPKIQLGLVLDQLENLLRCLQISFSITSILCFLTQCTMKLGQLVGCERKCVGNVIFHIFMKGKCCLYTAL